MKVLLVNIFLVAVLVGCTSETSETIRRSDGETIRINQVGYYPESIKEFVVVDHGATSFEIIDTNGQVVYKGDLKDEGKWEKSGENVKSGKFSEVDDPGYYKIRIDDKTESWSFAIRDHIYKDALNASIKSYYFQRASFTIEEEFGSDYNRKAGHADLACTFHPSTGREGNLDSPGGWYDAGDYGKYVVNASLTTGQMLNLVELYPEAVLDGQLNIPESGNGISDLMDEIKYELDWVLTMQDADGGVYHKLTALNFSGFIMPEDYDLERFIIGKGTASTLNFSAVMAQASRIYKDIDPEWSDKVLAASRAAWEWASYNYNSPFANPEDVVTGESSV